MSVTFLAFKVMSFFLNIYEKAKNQNNFAAIFRFEGTKDTFKISKLVYIIRLKKMIMMKKKE